MRFACSITKAKNIHPEYVILIAYPRQQWLRQTLLNMTLWYTARLVNLYIGVLCVFILRTKRKISLCEQKATYIAQHTKQVATQRCKKPRLLRNKKNPHFSNNIAETAVACLGYNLGTDPGEKTDKIKKK